MRKERVMRRLFALVLAVLTAVVLSYGCKGADDVVGPPDGDLRPPTPTPQVTGLRPTPNPCLGKIRRDC
jgi:hypothetical protein